MNIGLNQRPRLSAAARLRFDRQSRCHVLLSPERGLRLNPSATEVLMRCRGCLTVREIAEELVALYFGASVETADAPVAQVTKDVVALLDALERRGLLVLEPSP